MQDHIRTAANQSINQSAFAGQLTADDRNRINAVSRKALRRGVTLSHILLFLTLPPWSLFTHLLPPETSEDLLFRVCYVRC